MTGWELIDVANPELNLSGLGPVPLEMAPPWLLSNFVSPEQDIHCFTLGGVEDPIGYAPFLVHRTALSFNLGETPLLHLRLTRHALQGAPLCKSPAVLGGLFQPLFKAVGRRGVVFLEGVHSSSHLGVLLAQRDSAVYNYFHVVPYGPTYAHRLIDLPVGSNFEDYLGSLGSSSRRDVRRTRRDFIKGAKGQTRMTRYTQSSQAAELAHTLAQVSRKTYQHHLLGLGLENTPQFANQLRIAAEGGWLRAYVLWIDDKPVAFQLGYQNTRTYYGHHVGYDPDISKLQPGIYLHTELMADLLADGISRFDFLSGDSLYKQRMSNAFREERHYYLIPRGWPGTGIAVALVCVNRFSEVLGRWLDKIGVKDRLKRLVRRIAVKRGEINK